MELNSRLESSLRSVFVSSPSYYPYNGLNNDIFLDSHNAFGKSIVVDISSDEIEVPIIVKHKVEAAINRRIDGSDIQKVFIPLYKNSNATYEKRTADSLIYTLFQTPSSEMLREIYNKDKIYYGGKGIILDKDFNVLLACSALCRKKIINNRVRMFYYKPIIRVSPRVLIDSTDLVNKAIIKKIIPYYLTWNPIPIASAYGQFTYENTSDRKAQVTIEDLSNYFECPSAPSPNNCSDEQINNFLHNVIDELVAQL